MPKHSYDYVKNIYETNGCELLTTYYTHTKQKLEYKCKCKNIYTKSFRSFVETPCCIKCRNPLIIKNRNVQKLTYDYVKTEFELKNCKLLDDIYINNRTKMRYVCHCGNISEKSYNAFTQRSGCMKCTGSEKLTYDYVKQYFKDNGCILLSTNYVNIDRLLDY